MACQCASIRPGINVRPPPSMICAPSGAASPTGSTALILLPSTTTRRPSINWPDLPSNILTLVKTTGPAGASGIAADAPFGQRAETPAAAAPARNARRENFCSTRAFSRRNAGLWQIQPGDWSTISSTEEHTNKVVLLLARLCIAVARRPRVRTQYDFGRDLQTGPARTTAQRRDWPLAAVQYERLGDMPRSTRGRAVRYPSACRRATGGSSRPCPRLP